MAYPIKTFNQLRTAIIQEIRNLTGLTIEDDSDAAIRADGEASVVEGLYHHQTYIQKQLFVATADEPFLYIHAERLQCPRLAGSKASGRVKAISNTAVTIPAGSKITDGKGHYWLTIYTEQLSANKTKKSKSLLSLMVLLGILMVSNCFGLVLFRVLLHKLMLLKYLLV